MLACCAQALLTLAACRSQPAAEAPFHAGEARRPDVRRQQLVTLQPPTRMADALLVAPAGCHGSFGEAIAVNDTLVVVGAPHAEVDGRVWVYDATRLDAAPCMLQPPQGSRHERFGASVAVTPSGQWIAVGAPHAEVDGQRHAGRVYLWRRDGASWTLDHVFTDPDADTANEWFGAAVAVQDDCVMAGAPRASMKVTRTDLVPDRRRPAPPRPGQPERPPPSGEPVEVERVTQTFMQEGAVLSWMRQADGTWPQPAVSLLLRGRGGAGFGSTIALRENQAVIGAPVQRTRFGDQAGTVSIFMRREGQPWRRDAAAVIAPTTAEPVDFFGSAIATVPGLIAIGLPNANLKLAPDSGRVAIYRQNVESRVWAEEWWWQEGWPRQVLLQSPTPKTGSEFGRSVGICGRQVVVGEPNAARGRNSGRAFVFEKRDTPDDVGTSTWQVAQEWTLPPFAHAERFGMAMHATDTLVAISAPGSERVTGCVAIFRQTTTEQPADATGTVPAGERKANEDGSVAPSATDGGMEPPVSQPAQPSQTSP